jgi:hypothetical protein
VRHFDRVATEQETCMSRFPLASVLAVAATLCAAPAFAQGSSQGSTQGMSQGNGPAAAGSSAASSNAPAAQSAMPQTGGSHMSRKGTHAGTAHASRMHHGAMRTASADTGDAAVEHLNEMSLQAAQKNESFSPPGSKQ